MIGALTLRKVNRGIAILIFKHLLSERLEENI
jgi:hypothetical protein